MAKIPIKIPTGDGGGRGGWGAPARIQDKGDVRGEGRGGGKGDVGLYNLENRGSLPPWLQQHVAGEDRARDLRIMSTAEGPSWRVVRKVDSPRGSDWHWKAFILWELLLSLGIPRLLSWGQALLAPPQLRTNLNITHHLQFAWGVWISTVPAEDHFYNGLRRCPGL